MHWIILRLHLDTVLWHHCKQTVVLKKNVTAPDGMQRVRRAAQVPGHGNKHTNRGRSRDK